MNKKTKKILLALVVVGIIVGIYSIESRKVKNDSTIADVTQSDINARIMSQEDKARQYEIAKEITTPNAFINTDPVTIQELIGKKVILVDFWTYSCINCQRTLPYLNAWHEKYANEGLVIIGVHTPEFKFEEDLGNVQAAVDKFNIKYPVVLDNDYSTWQGYKNRYWPRKYLIDIDGFIVYDHIGEGAYEQTEVKIQELLQERARLFGEKSVTPSIANPKEAEEVNVGERRSPEIYFGAARNERFANGVQGMIGAQKIEVPKEVNEDLLYLDGTWYIDEEFAQSKSENARIIFPYRAQKVFFVAGAKEPTTIRVFKDGELVNELEVQDSTLYRLIEDKKTEEHLLEIEIVEPGLNAFTFTFG
jgi:thiol-disulfide isomerase/thioredoxin